VSPASIPVRDGPADLSGLYRDRYEAGGFTPERHG
jgi:hypothetical protein